MTPMMMLLILLGVLSSIFVILLIYRNTLEMHEDDQLFIGSAESHMAKEQEELQLKMSKIEPMVRWVGAACEQRVELATESEAYMRRRLAQARAGALAVTVDHADLLALP